VLKAGDESPTRPNRNAELKEKKIPKKGSRGRGERRAELLSRWIGWGWKGGSTKEPESK